MDDPGIRRLLRPWLRRQHPGDSRVIDELGLCRGQVRVDVAVVGELVHGYEIKSDRDNLRRLPAQVKVYSQVLDRATLVVGQAHYERASALIPVWWGLVRILAGAGLEVVREPGGNPSLDKRALVELIWRPQALELLEQRGAARGVRGRTRPAIWDRVCAVLTTDEVADVVRRQLKKRVGARPL